MVAVPMNRARRLVHSRDWPCAGEEKRRLCRELLTVGRELIASALRATADGRSEGADMACLRSSWPGCMYVPCLAVLRMKSLSWRHIKSSDEINVSSGDQ